MNNKISYKKRALKSLKGRWISVVLMIFISLTLSQVFTILIEAGGFTVASKITNTTIEKQVMEYYKKTVGIGFKANVNISEEKRNIELEEYITDDIDRYNVLKIVAKADKIMNKNIGLKIPLGIVLFVLGVIGLMSMLACQYKIYLNAARIEDVEFRDLFQKPKIVIKFTLVAIIQIVLIILGTIMLVVPGVIISLRFYYVYLYVFDDPNKSIVKYYKEAWESTKESTLELFTLCVSFFGWALLGEILISILSYTNLDILGSNLIHAIYYTYFYTAIAHFYIRKANKEMTINTLEENF